MTSISFCIRCASSPASATDVLGPHRHLGDLGDEAGLLERRLHRLEVGAAR